MAPAAKMESGVTGTTTSVMVGLMESINASVPTMGDDAGKELR